MNHKQALELLNLDKARCALTAEIVREAFSSAVKRHHPDAQGQAVTPKAVADIDAIKQARDYLLKNLTPADDFTCKLCDGVGSVRHKFGRTSCVACRGTGARQ